MSKFSGPLTFYSLPVILHLHVFQTDYKLHFNEFSINLCSEAGQHYGFFIKECQKVENKYQTEKKPTNKPTNKQHLIL